MNHLDHLRQEVPAFVVLSTCDSPSLDFTHALGLQWQASGAGHLPAINVPPTSSSKYSPVFHPESMNSGWVEVQNACHTPL